MKLRRVALLSISALVVGALYAFNMFSPAGRVVSSMFIASSNSSPDELVVWHPWGGTQKEKVEEVAREFERAHPGIRVRMVFTPNNLSDNQKLFTAISAGKPPDVTFVDGPQVSEWAEQGALQRLDGCIQKAGIRSSDYFEPAWKENCYKGHVWALPYQATRNCPFAWNKQVFRSAGLDPNKPPRTISELDDLSNKITKVENRQIKRIGIIPWAQYGYANSLFFWGFAFGGEFYDEKRGRITANDPRVVKALDWICSYARKYEVTKIESMSQGFGSLDRHPFYTGEAAMYLWPDIMVEDARRYAPGLDYGLGYIPAPPDGEAHSSWMGGWCLSLPAGSRHTELGWEFIRWTCNNPAGTFAVGEKQNIIPAYKRSPYFQHMKGDPKYKVYLRLLETCRHQRPVMPAQAYYMGSLDRAVEAAIYGLKTPKQALDDATAETQRELDLRLRGN